MISSSIYNQTFQLPYLVMMGVCFVGAFATIFLPETHDVKLPETLEVGYIYIYIYIYIPEKRNSKTTATKKYPC